MPKSSMRAFALGLAVFFSPALIFTYHSAPALAVSQELLVGAASSLQESLKEVGDAYSKESPAKVVYSFAASSELVQQATRQAPLDVVFSADEANMDKLEKLSLLAPGSRVAVLANEVVLIVRSGGPAAQVKTLEDLRSPAIKRVALCDEAVPIGHYGHAWLQRHNLDKELAPKLVQAANVRAALALVASGGADAGFVYATDALATAANAKTTVAVRAAPSDGLVVRYPVAILKASQHQAAAQTFLAFLRSPKAAAIFKARGFTPVAP